MVSTVMLSAVRTILDEASASFWTDAEIYAALADGQNECIKELLSIYRAKKRIDPDTKLFYELESLLVDDVGSTQTVSIPTGFLELISATFDHDNTGGEKPCFIKDLRTLSFEEDNTYSVATSTQPVVYIKSVSDVTKIVFLPTVSGTAAFTIHYIKSPTDIAAGQNAILPVTTHQAIVNIGASRMLLKDQRPQEAQMLYGLYIQEIKNILGV